MDFQAEAVLKTFFHGRIFFSENYKKILTKAILRDMIYYVKRGIVWIYS